MLNIYTKMYFNLNIKFVSLIYIISNRLPILFVHHFKKKNIDLKKMYS